MLYFGINSRKALLDFYSTNASRLVEHPQCQCDAQDHVYHHGESQEVEMLWGTCTCVQVVESHEEYSNPCVHTLDEQVPIALIRT